MVVLSSLVKNAVVFLKLEHKVNPKRTLNMMIAFIV